MVTNPLGSVLSNKASLTLAYIERLSTSYPTEKRVNVGESAILEVPKIDSYPPPTYEWYAGDALIIPNQKFAISKSNNLIILATERSDEKFYYVKAANIHTGSEIRSKDIKLMVNDESLYSMDSLNTIIEPTFVVKPVDTVAKLNDNLVKFDCILNAKPLDQLEITWYKDGQLIDFKTSKYRLYQMSRSIEIISISDQDAGLYTCSAKFAQYTALNASAKLDVYIKPTFKTQPPSLIETDIGKTIDLKCEGIANPRGVISWYKNANLIDAVEQSNVIFSESNTRLAIHNVGKEDEAIYQCFISNEAGQISSSSLIRIISFAPRFLPLPLNHNDQLANQTVFSESNAKLSCNVVASPKAKIFWQKLDLLNSQSYVDILALNNDFTTIAPYSLNDNGDLIIKSVNLRNAGWYKCIGENLLGSISQNLYLHVKKKTEIIEPPMNISVIKGQSATLKCTVSREEDIDVDIRWKFNDIIVDFDEKTNFNVNNNLKYFPLNGSLQILEAKNTDIGLYKCLVSSVAGNDSKIAYLNVVELPYPPENVFAELYGAVKRTANITWSPTFDGNNAIIKYVLQARLIPYDSNLYETLPNDWLVIKDNILNSGQYWTLVNDLMPAMVYQFRLSAVNSIGEGDVSLFSNNLTIPEEVPSAAPRNLQAQLILSNSIQLAWMPPLNNAWNGKLFGYVIAYSLSYPNSTWKYVKVSDYTQTLANITDLIEWEIYLIKICAFNLRGNGLYSEPPIRVRTKEGIPIRAPLNFRAYAINSTCISMSWNAPPPQFVNGIILGYKLIMMNTSVQIIDNLSPNLLSNSSSSSSIQYFQCGLLKFTQYSLSVLAFTSSGDGPLTNPLKLTTLEDVPGEINEIRFLNVYDTSIEIEWEPPLQPNGRILEYILAYRQLNSTKFTTISLNSTQQNFTLNGLKSSTDYLINIHARTQAGDGLEKSTQIKSGVPPELPEPPRAIVIKNIAQTSVQLEFIPGYSGKTSINKWIVEGLRDKNREWRRIYEKYSPNATSLIVDRLQPFTNYTLRMIAANIKGLSQPSSSTEMFQTLADVPSQTPASLYSRVVNQTSIQVKWTPIATKNWNSIPYGYIIVCNKVKIELKSTKTAEYILTNLTPWTTYEIKIAAFNSVGIGAYSRIIFANTSEYRPTKAPQSLNVYAFNHTAVHLNWKLIDSSFINGIQLGYKIRFTKSSGGSLYSYKSVVDANQYETIISGLDGYTDYKFEICGFTRMGDGQYSMPMSTRTPEFIPSKPYNIYFPQVNLTAITIKWSKPLRMNGLLRGYRLMYQKYSTVSSMTQLKFNIINSDNMGNNDFKVFYLDSFSSNFTISGLHKMEYYFFKICANTSVGWGEEAHALVYTIDKRSFPEPPTQLVVSKSSIKSRELVLNWNMGNENYSPIRYYTLQYNSQEEGGDWLTLNEQIDGAVTSYSVQKILKPNRNYRFRVAATNDIGESDFSVESENVRTKEEAPEGAPENISVVIVSSTLARVKWNEANGEKSNGIVLKYKISYKLIGEEVAKFVEIIVDYPQNEHLIKNLSPNGTYEITMSLVNSIGEGPPSQFILFYMQDALPSRAPQIKQISSLSSNELSLSWSTPTEQTINGKLYGFKIYFIDTPLINNNTQSMFNNFIVIEPNINSTILINLKSYTTYTVCMQLFNQAGDSPTSNLVSEQTLESTPSPPKSIKFSFIAFTYLNMSWQEPESPNGFILSYEILYENIPIRLGGSKIKTIRQEVSNATTLHIKDLEPRNEYKFQIRCRTKIGWSDWSNSTVKTGPQNGSPLEPTKPNFIIINETLLILEWKFYSKDFDYFLVHVRYVDDDGGVNYQNLSDEKFEFFTFTKKTRLEISRDQLKGSCRFHVYAVNSKGISESSQPSDKLNLPQNAAVTTQQRKQPIYTNWWFLVILALSTLTIIIALISGMCLRGKNKNYLAARNLALRSKTGTQSTLIDPDNMYLPADLLNQASSLYELRQSKRGLNYNNTGTMRSIYDGNAYLTPSDTLGKAYKIDTVKSFNKQQLQQHYQQHTASNIIQNDYCTASKVGILVNNNQNNKNIYNTGTLYGNNNNEATSMNESKYAKYDAGAMRLLDKPLDFYDSRTPRKKWILN